MSLKVFLRLLQPKTLAIGLVKFYKYFISPYTGSRCRYYPSCSSYALEAFETKGFIRGLILSVYRIIRCNPISSGGYDPVNKEDKFIFRDV